MTARAKREPLELYLNSGSDWSIQDQHGKKYSIEQAKQLHEKRARCEFQHGYARLVSHGFDVEATKASFKSLSLR